MEPAAEIAMLRCLLASAEERARLWEVIASGYMNELRREREEASESVFEDEFSKMEFRY